MLVGIWRHWNSCTALVEMWNGAASVRTVLAEQRIRTHLPLQGTRVQSLVREDSTCWGAAKPRHHNHTPKSLRSATGEATTTSRPCAGRRVACAHCARGSRHTAAETPRSQKWTHKISKCKQSISVGSSNSALRDILRRMQSSICPWLFIATVFTIGSNDPDVCRVNRYTKRGRATQRNVIQS